MPSFLNGAKIGKNCLIGANTLITEGKEIPDNSMVMGVLSQVVRTLSEEQAKEFEQGPRTMLKTPDALEPGP